MTEVQAQCASQAEGSKGLDPLLASYLSEADDEAARDLLSGLISEHAMPVVRSVVGYRLRFRHYSGDAGVSQIQEVEDVCADTFLQLIRRLQEARCRRGELLSPISSIRNYAAVVAYNACDAYLRHRYPDRYSFRGRVRYILLHNPAFSVSERSGGNLLCSLTAKGRTLLLRLGNVTRSPIEDLVFAIAQTLAEIVEPIDIEDLVSAVFERFRPVVRRSVPMENINHEIAARTVPVDEQIDRRRHLLDLWNEVTQLPLRQRRALILNLRGPSGEEVISMLPILEIASIVEIANILEYRPDEFAALWNELPLEDLKIAALLGITRQQVINLRKSARERLSRRTRPGFHSRSVI